MRQLYAHELISEIQMVQIQGRTSKKSNLNIAAHPRLVRVDGGEFLKMGNKFLKKMYKN